MDQSGFARSAVAVAVSLIVACGNDDSTPVSEAGGATAFGGVGTGDGGTTGGSSGGASTSGGSPASGGEVPGGGGGVVTGQHCTPAVPIDPAKSVRNCHGYNASKYGIPPGSIVVREIYLPTPVGPTNAYPISMRVDYAVPGDVLELWGTNALCGQAGELLYSAPMVSGSILCATLRPATGAYESVLMVWRGSTEGGISEPMSCVEGTCG